MNDIAKQEGQLEAQEPEESAPDDFYIDILTGNREKPSSKKWNDRPPAPWSLGILPANRLQTACSSPLKEAGPNTAFGKTSSNVPEL